MTAHVRAGVLRLADSAPIIVAQARGYFAMEGLDVSVVVEPSWSNIADKMAFGLLDAAVMLPPLALAAAAGARGAAAKLVVPMGISQGGNTIALRQDAARAVAGARDAAMAARLLLAWLRAQPTRPALAVVHAFSTHNLLLRHWLAAAGANPGTDWDTVIVPPNDVVASLAEGQVAGFCAGAPWGDEAERLGTGRVVLGTSSIWPAHPEKCLAVTQAWLDRAPAHLPGLLRAVARAMADCDDPAQAEAIATVLAQPSGLRLPLRMTCAVLAGATREPIRFRAGAAIDRGHGEWFVRELMRWGYLPAATDAEALVAAVYRPDLVTPS
jgi:two-component system, oxyanion-binding sensor